MFFLISFHVPFHAIGEPRTRTLTKGITDELDDIAMEMVAHRSHADNVRRRETALPLPPGGGALARAVTMHKKKAATPAVTPKVLKAKAKPKVLKATATPKVLKAKATPNILKTKATSTATPIEDIAVVTEEAAPALIGLSQTAKCIKSRAYHGAFRLEKAKGSSPADCKAAAQKAYTEAAASCRLHGIK